MNTKAAYLLGDDQLNFKLPPPARVKPKGKDLEISAALLVYRRKGDSLEVLLIHPGGPYWANKDLGAWSLPKGLVEPGEDEFEAAKREFREETGLEPPSGQYTFLGEVKLRSGKRIRAWAGEGDFDVTRLKSNAFPLEWPPKSGKFRYFPEADRGGWFTPAEAKQKLLLGQVDFVDGLLVALKLSR
jgi:predicted NUDIX family NTP pyrophosphohydrolase